MKKQIAVLMAAATAVTTVAPVLASADVNTSSISISEVNAKIKAALDERYKNANENGLVLPTGDEVDAYMNSRYAVAIVASGNVGNLFTNYANAVVATADSGYKAQDGKAKQIADKVLEVAKKDDSSANFQNNGVYFVKDASKVQGLIEALSFTAGVNFRVVVVDKGIKDGSAVETLKNKHYVVNQNDDLSEELKKTEVSLNAFTKELVKNLKKDNQAGFVKSIKVNGTTDVTEDANFSSVAVSNVEFTLTSGKEFKVEANNQAYDLIKPVDAKGEELNLQGEGNAQSVFDKVVGFKYIANDDDKPVKVVLPLGDSSVYTVQNVEVRTMELGKIFTRKDGYTKEGADFVNALVAAKNNKVAYKGFNFKGVNYTFNEVGTNNLKPVIESTKEGWVLKYTVNVDDNTNGYKNINLQFVINGDSQKDLKLVLSNLEGETDVVAGYFTRLQGANRYDTAIEVSKEAYADGNASTVVIVGGEALMDGLSAVPLAAKKNAPILLANPNTGLSNETLDEIARATDKSPNKLYRKIVYIVGGENSVPKSVEKQLEDKFGVVVVRLSGTDRYETSLEVAQAIPLTADRAGRTVFLVGGEGAADAMSVSPVAATKGLFGNNNVDVAPIVVVPKAGLSKNTRSYLNNTFNNAVLVGGESSLSTNVFRGLDAITNKSRIAGSDRYDTNNMLLNKYYVKYDADAHKNDKVVDGQVQVRGALFASGDSKFLVDAQTAGPLAAAKQAPIVLSGSKLTDDQLKLFKTGGVLDGLKSSVFQVGGVVSSDVMSAVVEKLGL